jgi:hypothetical protein
MKKLLSLVGLLSACVAFAQTTNPPVFLGSSFDTAGAIGLQWASQSNLVYRIDYADTLVNSNTQWNILYEDFPSQGTNTIWKDGGREFAFPKRIPHPNDTQKRFYRVALTGTNSGVQPQVAVLSPTNGSVLSDYTSVSVGVTSVMSVVAIRLFVDGQEAGFQLYPATNFIINTAQFPNGPHRLFAVAETMDGAETTVEATAVTNNFTASPFNNVTFDNFISDFRGSALFVEPTNNETITFKANFAAYSDWTLTISNSSAVTVRTTSGTGNNMAFAWDGRGQTSNSLAADFYSATLSAMTSTNVPQQDPPSTNPPPSFNGAQQATVDGGNDALAWYPTDASGAIMAGWGYYLVPPPPLPPKLAEELGPQPWLPVLVRGTLSREMSVNSVQTSGAEGGPLAAAAAGGGTTTLIPPIVVHNFGTMGIAYQGHHPRTGFSASSRPANGIGGRVRLNNPNNDSITGAWGPLKACWRIATGFGQTMEQSGYQLGWGRANDNITAADLRGSQYGGSNQFNKYTIGLLVGHGVFGADVSQGIDFAVAGGTKLTYFPIYKTGVNSYDWVKFNEFKFGTSGSALRWMNILSCNNMIDHCYDDMYDKGVLPIGNNLHLLCGSASTVYIVSSFGLQYGSALGGRNGVARRSVKDSWFYAGNVTQGFQTNSPKHTVFFRVAGWPACFSDDLVTYSNPDSGNPANITSDKEQVYPPQ